MGMSGASATICQGFLRIGALRELYHIYSLFCRRRENGLKWLVYRYRVSKQSRALVQSHSSCESILEKGGEGRKVKEWRGP
jgi:hypothetical protein